MRRQAILAMLEQEPEDMDVDRFLRMLWVQYKIELRLAPADTEPDIPQEQFDREYFLWLHGSVVK